MLKTLLFALTAPLLMQHVWANTMPNSSPPSDLLLKNFSAPLAKYAECEQSPFTPAGAIAPENLGQDVLLVIDQLEVEEVHIQGKCETTKGDAQACTVSIGTAGGEGKWARIYQLEVDQALKLTNLRCFMIP